MKTLRVVLVKPSKYEIDGFVQRYSKGLMPNSTLSHIASLTPDVVDEFATEVVYVDEYIHTNLTYLTYLQKSESAITLVAIVGVQSHQFHRAIDLAAYAKNNGVENVIIGGPHAMTCDTNIVQGKGVSFSVSEAEVVWLEVLSDATKKNLKDIYGLEQRWATKIPNTLFKPPPVSEVNKHWVPMVGYYPVRGCPFTCKFCSVIKIAGRNVRNPSVETILFALQEIRNIGVEFVIFTSDNFNKFPIVDELLDGIIERKLGIRFWFQADTQIADQERLLQKIARAGGAEMFVGAESFDSYDLSIVHKRHNQPKKYEKIISMCRDFGIRSHISNIIGFPDQNEEKVQRHLDQLVELDPDLASFYVLTPIPGTEQYGEYLDRGVIFERNLDRFDASTPTFNHDGFSPESLQQSLFDSYETFYKQAMKRRKANIDRETRNYMVFCRRSAALKTHPMSSGLGAVRLDKSEDYLKIRRAVFDVGSMLPLPRNLPLSSRDEMLNKNAKWIAQSR